MKSVITWFANNHVAANLLMLAICFAGVMTALTIKQEVFPEMELDMIQVQVIYLGGTPSEVEESVCIKIEEQVQGIDGIKKIVSTAAEGLGVVTIELERGADGQKVLDDVKSEVDRIITFPAETEKPVVTLLERRMPVIDMIVAGEVSERTLKVLADNIRDDLVALDEITYAEVVGTRPYEISIEVSEQALRSYGLSLADVTRAVRLNSLDLPGGSVKTQSGEILVRTKGQRYTGEQFGSIVVIPRSDGTEVTLDEIATIKDGFEDIDVAARLDGKPAAMISVYRTGDEGVLGVANAVKQYVADQADALPAGVTLTTWYDRSEIYRSRMNLLTRNGLIGLMLVFLCLTTFLQLRLAFWVALGIAISFLGAFYVIPWFGVSLNMISMFAFIVSLGIVVDDAIVVGENIFSFRERGYPRQRAATQGALEVSSPVIFAVLTTVVAFLPLAFVEGLMGKFMFNIPVVVIAILVFSLIESLLILPAHLSTIKQAHKSREIADAEVPPTGLTGWYHRNKGFVQRKLEYVVERVYRRHLDWALAHRGLVVALAIAGFMLTVGLVAGRHIRFTFMPQIDSDNVICSLTLAQGSTLADATAAVDQIEAALARLQEEIRSERPVDAPEVFQNTFTTIGSQPRGTQRVVGHGAGGAGGGGAHLVEVVAELESAERRGMSSSEIARRWRDLTGPVPGSISLAFSANLFAGGKAIQIQLSSPSTPDLLAAARFLKEELANYPGVTDISDSFREGKVEVKLNLKPEARSLGLTLNDLARQVRQGFYGDEAMRIQRRRDEVKVMVRYPELERRSLGHVENMRIRTPGGAEVPFHRVAEVTTGRGYASIERADRQRIVNVLADVDQTVTNAAEVLADLRTGALASLLENYPTLRYSLEGEERDRAESMASLGRGFIFALLMIYILLAVLFKSYAQPLIVMSAIPFGLMGAVLGHVGMGMDLTMLSMFGVVALTGVVVNDSLIMIDFINRARRTGVPMRTAVLDSGVRRFRPIMLTSVTTFAGLTPLLLEKSLQARFLVPMAVSLGFGVVFATVITLMLIPVSYTLLADFLRKVSGQDDIDDDAAQDGAEVGESALPAAAE